MKNLIILFIILLSSVSAIADTYPLPSVPDSLRTPKARAAYLIQHFWDEADFAAPRLKDSIDSLKIEQSFVDFISIFPHASELDRKCAVARLMDKALANPLAYDWLSSLAQKYLYNVDSPMRDEESFILFLQHIVNAPIESSKKIRPEILLEDVNKNRVGNIASDFSFENRNGEHQNLYGIDSEGDILLMFYDPDCDHCASVIQNLGTDEKTLEKINTGQLSVIAIYSGEDKTRWDQTKDSMPSQWTVGYDDGTIQDNDIYIIREMPTLYILSSDKKVKIKELNYHNLDLLNF